MKKDFTSLFKFPEREIVLSFQLRQVVANRIVLLTLVVAFVYYFVDHWINTQVTHAFFISIFISCLVVLFISISGYFKLAKNVGLLLYIFIMFNICGSQNFATGIHLHLITGAFIALIVFGYEERYWGISYALLAFLAFTASFLFRVSIFPYREFEIDQRNIFFILNVVVFAAMNLYLVMLILRLNYHVEFALYNKNKELNQANVELDRFVYSVSHDLRAPLNSISGLLALLRAAPTETSYFDKVEGRLAVMKKFIGDITDFSRNARAAVKKEEVAVFRLVKEIVDTLDGSQGNRPIQFLIDVNEDLVFFSEPLRLRIILNNLISNALKYADHSKLNPYVHISAWREPGNFGISVADNGIGIASEFQPKVFDMFFRATTSSSGSGLGLFIVKESLEKLKGTIHLHSDLGVGTTVRIVLPEAE